MIKLNPLQQIIITGFIFSVFVGTGIYLVFFVALPVVYEWYLVSDGELVEAEVVKLEKEDFSPDEYENNPFRIKISYSYTYDGKAYLGNTFFPGHDVFVGNESTYRLFLKLESALRSENFMVHVCRNNPKVSAIFNELDNQILIMMFIGVTFMLSPLFVIFANKKRKLEEMSNIDLVDPVDPVDPVEKGTL